MKRSCAVLLCLLLPSALRAATTTLKYHGHAAWEIVTPKGHVLFVDPWLSNPQNPAGKKALDSVKRCDYILVTHGHFDHVGDAVELARKTKARLVTNFELGTNMARLLGYPADQMGFDTLMNVGGRITIADGEATVEMTPAIHSSGLDAKTADGKETIAYGGNPSGFLIRIKDGPTIYDTGDTAYFRDMDQLAAADVDAALINIGGHFGMEPDAAATAARAVNARLVIPQHFGTFPILTQDPAPFFKDLDDDKIPHRLMKAGDTLTFNGREPQP